MKKLLACLLALLMIFTLAGCAAEEGGEEAEGTDEEVTAKGVYTIANDTGRDVGGVYIYPVGSTDKGENYVTKLLADPHYTYLQNFKSIVVDASVDEKFAEWTGMKSETPHFVFEFYALDKDAEDQCGELIGKFENLALEEATIVLINEDMRAGATEISWGPSYADGFTMKVNFYNHTGSTVTSLKAYDSETGEEVADILAECGVESIADQNEEAVVWSHSESIENANTRHFNIEWETEDGQKLSLMTEGYASHPLSFENTDMVLRNADLCAGATTVWWISATAED